MVTISERINQLMLAAFHYRNRELLMMWITSAHNRDKFYEAEVELEAQKKSLLTAISNDKDTTNIY